MFNLPQELQSDHILKKNQLHTNLTLGLIPQSPDGTPDCHSTCGAENETRKISELWFMKLPPKEKRKQHVILTSMCKHLRLWPSHSLCSPKFRQPFFLRHTVDNSCIRFHSSKDFKEKTRELKMRPGSSKFRSIITFPQNSQKNLLCWLISIFLICLRKLAP